MTESAFWTSLKPHVKGHVVRIENATGSGVPDVNACYKGREVWIELKVLRGTNKPALRPSQKAWLLRRLNADATNLFVLARRDDQLRLWRWSSIYSMIMGNAVTHPDWTSDKKFDWEGLNRELFGGDW